MVFVDKRSTTLAILAVLCTAALLLAGNGMNPRWPLLWVAPIPVLLLAAETAYWWVAGSAAALSMLLGSLNMLYYMHLVLMAPVTAWLIPYSIASLLFAVGVLLFRSLLRRGSALRAAVALPAFWSVGEYAASFVPQNGTAGSLAYTQEGFLPILQVASLTGPWGITFLLLLFPSALVSGWYLRRSRPRQAVRLIAVTAGIFAAALVFGMTRLTTESRAPSIQVGLLDTDATMFAERPAAMRDLMQSYAEQAARLAQQGAKIVLMPEKTGLLLEANRTVVDSTLQPVADGTGATLVIGVLHVVAEDSFNEARIYRPGRPVAMYHKQHMLPPFESKLKPGTLLTLLPTKDAAIGVAICKDMDFVHPALDYGRAGVGLVLDPAWDFGADRVWHGHIAIMRGVEGGYAVAHAAKNGLLTVSDNRGRILGETMTRNGFASLLVDVPLRHERTIFDRYGAWFPWMALLLLLVAVGWRV